MEEGEDDTEKTVEMEQAKKEREVEQTEVDREKKRWTRIRRDV